MKSVKKNLIKSISIINLIKIKHKWDSMMAFTWLKFEAWRTKLTQVNNNESKIELDVMIGLSN